MFHLMIYILFPVLFYIYTHNKYLVEWVEYLHLLVLRFQSINCYIWKVANFLKTTGRWICGIFGRMFKRQLIISWQIGRNKFCSCLLNHISSFAGCFVIQKALPMYQSFGLHWRCLTQIHLCLDKKTEGVCHDKVQVSTGWKKTRIYMRLWKNKMFWLEWTLSWTAEVMENCIVFFRVQVLSNSSVHTSWLEKKRLLHVLFIQQTHSSELLIKHLWNNPASFNTGSNVARIWSRENRLFKGRVAYCVFVQ